MGSPGTENGRNNDETQHQVEMTRTIYFSKYEITVGQFRKFVNATGYVTEAEKFGYGGTRLNPVSGDTDQSAGATWRNPGNENTDRHPVVQVSWNDTNKFLAWLGKQEGLQYRLPSQARNLLVSFQLT